MSGMKKLSVAILFVIVIAAACLYFFAAPYSAFPNETFVRIERGTGTLDIGRALAQSGVIRYPWQLWVERALHPGAKLQAGEYRFHQPATPGDVFSRLATHHPTTSTATQYRTNTT